MRATAVSSVRVASGDVAAGVSSTSVGTGAAAAADSAKARELANAGVTLVRASLEDTAALTKALEGATSLFAMTTPYEGGTQAENATRYIGSGRGQGRQCREDRSY